MSKPSTTYCSFTIDELQAGRTFSERTSRKVWGPVNGDERCRTSCAARCAGLRGMTCRNNAGLRAATMNIGTREIRTQKASSEAKCPTGQTWSARERRKRCARPNQSPFPVLRALFFLLPIAPFDADFALFLPDRDELVLEQRIRERIVGPDMKRSRLFSLQGREKDQFSALHQVDRFKTAH